jgi:hypothetical protein
VQRNFPVLSSIKRVSWSDCNRKPGKADHDEAVQLLGLIMRITGWAPHCTSWIFNLPVTDLDFTREMLQN